MSLIKRKDPDEAPTSPVPYVASKTPAGRLLSLLLAVDMPVSSVATAVCLPVDRLRASLTSATALSLAEVDRLAVLLPLAWGRWYDRRGIEVLDHVEDERLCVVLEELGGDASGLVRSW